ncbi:unnamed protein product, partial [Musa textilis]
CVEHLSDCSLVSRIITCTLLVNLFCSFERDLAAEALKVNENDVQKALDLLTNPERNCALQRRKLGASSSSGADIEELVSLGHDRSLGISLLDLFLRQSSDASKLLVGANSEDSQHATINQSKDE